MWGVCFRQISVTGPFLRSSTQQLEFGQVAIVTVGGARNHFSTNGSTTTLNDTVGILSTMFHHSNDLQAILSPVDYCTYTIGTSEARFQQVEL